MPDAKLRELRVPFALDEAGVVLAASTAPHGAQFKCLECGQRLALRRRAGQRPHFTHFADAVRNCTGESVTHQAAKLLLQEQIRTDLEEHSGVRWHLRCPGVDGKCRDHAVFEERRALPQWDSVALEVAYGQYRFDVAVVRDGVPVFGFEVFYRHEVPEAKAQRINVPWLELLADDILAYRPRVPWKEPYADKLCEACRELEDRLRLRRSDDKVRDKVSAEFAAEQGRVAKAWQAVLGRARAMRG